MTSKQTNNQQISLSPSLCESAPKSGVDYPDAKATAGGWTVKVYDPEGLLVSPSLTAQSMAEMMASGKVDRDALLEIAREMPCVPDEFAPFALREYARRIRKALGVE